MNYHTRPPLKVSLRAFYGVSFTEQVFVCVIKSLSKTHTKKKKICYAIQQKTPAARSLKFLAYVKSNHKRFYNDFRPKKLSNKGTILAAQPGSMKEYKGSQKITTQERKREKMENLNLNLSKDEFNELAIALDQRLDDFRMLLSRDDIEELHPDQQKTYTICQSLLTQIKDLTKTPKGLPTLSTYQILTGTTYEVEATTEDEALDRFHAWYANYYIPIEAQEFTDITCEEGEVLTVVIGHD